MTPLRLQLPHSEYWVHPESRLVETRFPDGKACAGTREDSDENQREALDQGYTGDDMVWRSLADHECLHSLVSLWLWDTASPTLRHESGAERVPYALRLAEEGIVISTQRYLNSGEVWWPLKQYEEQLPWWRQRFTAAISQMEEAA